MFRELTRKNKQLTREACVKLLKEEKRGVLSVVGDGDYPYGMPMNHWYNEQDGCLYFHCGKNGHRLDSLRKQEKVSFCVCDKGYCREGEWALQISSVIVFGRMEIIDDRDAVVSVSEQLCRKFTQDEEFIRREIAAYARETLLLKLIPQHICGKKVSES